MPNRTTSCLVDLVKLSPNCTKPRTGRIRRLTPHHMAGNFTIEAVLNSPSFAKHDPKTGRSATYIIGSDGRCGQGVEEVDRPWTSSSPTNDHEAITFEIANIAGEPDWQITDEAINKFLDMAVDACRFYGFKKVNYQPKPSNMTPAKVEAWIKTWAKDDEMIITLHNWFTATTCPGSYFTNLIPQLVVELNRRLSSIPAIQFIAEKTVIIRPVLRQGSSGEFVKELQTKLNKPIVSGDKLTVDGIFGAKTDALVREFQNIKSLKVDGIVGPATWAKLDEVFTPEPQKPAVSNKKESTPYTIRINSAALNVRGGPGTNNRVVQTLIRDQNIYTIVAEADGPGASKWGKLKSGLGWVSLDHVKKV